MLAHRGLLWNAAELLLAGAVGLVTGHAVEPYLGHRASLVVSVAIGGGAGAGLWGKRSGQPKPFLHALGAAAGGALGAYLAMRLVG